MWASSIRFANNHRQAPKVWRPLSGTAVAMGRDLDESTVVHSDTKINWPIKSDLENDIQVGITMNI